MPKKIKKVVLSTKKVNNPKVEYLQKLILISEKQIDGKSKDLDDLFKAQADRVRKELKEAQNAK